MQDQKKGQSTGSTGSRTGGSAGTAGRTGAQVQNRSDLPNTSTGDWTGAPPEAVTHQPGEETSEQAGMSQTSAMLRKGQGQTGMRSQGQSGMQGQSDLPDTTSGNWTGAPPERVTHGRGEQESEDAGMQQVSRMLREEREEGDPEMMRREEDLHARQQNLGEREMSLRERDEQLRTREQGLRQRQSSITGRGMGATDYQEYRVRNDR
ncbi:MAG: hypothetical protein ABFC89_13235 [Methanospirillum sp.]